MAETRVRFLQGPAHAALLAELSTAVFADSPERSLDPAGAVMLLKQESVGIFILVKDELLIGFCLIQACVPESDILSIGLIPEARGLGHAQVLIDEVSANLSKMGVRQVTLEVRENNDKAIKLYEKSGFYHIGNRSNYYKIDGNRSVDARIYQRNIKAD